MQKNLLEKARGKNLIKKMVNKRKRHIHFFHFLDIIIRLIDYTEQNVQSTKIKIRRFKDRKTVFLFKKKDSKN